MDLDIVITQLRQYATGFNGNIAGAADFETGLSSTVNLPYPSAFVLPLGEAPDLENLDATGLYQNVTEHIGIIVEVSSTADRRGQTAVTGLDSLRASVFSAILNWHYDENSQKGLSYVGAELIVFDRARLFWKWEFANSFIITDEDGFQVTGPPLTDIQVFDQNSPTSFDTPIPQTT
jgi:hypothetical protein